jgi:hypothetical protein
MNGVTDARLSGFDGADGGGVTTGGFFVGAGVGDGGAGVLGVADAEGEDATEAIGVGDGVGVGVVVPWLPSHMTTAMTPATAANNATISTATRVRGMRSRYQGEIARGVTDSKAFGRSRVVPRHPV